MLKGGPRLSAQDTTPQTTRQKKRLSFKDPEIEGPQQLYLGGGGCTPKRPTASNLIERQRGKECLSLEDQAFHIAHNVGSAFSDLSLQETGTADYFDTRANSSAEIEDSKAEALINDCFLRDPSYQRNYQQQSLRISAEDQEFLDDLSPPLQIPNMRCPPIEGSEHHKRNSIPSMGEFPSSAQHQIQLLKYQLDQQSQQTQLAFHQIQLLTDQVGAENAARLKAQEQNNQLMMQNQELLNHIERLFQQIEELEKQVQVLERSSKIPHIQESQPTHYRTRPTYAGNRRLSSDSTSEKPTLTDHGNFSTPRRGSFATSKTSASQQHKIATNPPPPKLAISPPQLNPPQQNRRSPLTSPKPYAPSIQNRLANDPRGKETLHIGDTSPPAQSEATTSPFGSGWKLKQTTQPEPEKTRTRTGSFGSFSKLKPPESINPKSTVLSSSSASSAVGITNKKYSSSTSDLYSSTSAYQISKPLGMEDTAASGKTAISNVNVATSKLPRFQPYTGSGRRSSLTKDFDQFSVVGKDKFKTAPQTSFFNR